MSSAKRKFVIVLPPILISFRVFKCVSHYSLYEGVEEGGGEQTSSTHSNCGSEPFSHVAVIVD